MEIYLVAEPLTTTSIRLSWQLSDPVWDVFVVMYLLSYQRVDVENDGDGSSEGNEEVVVEVEEEEEKYDHKDELLVWMFFNV